MRAKKHWVTYSVALFLCISSGRTNAQPNTFVPFKEFVAGTTATVSSSFLAQPGARVADAASFDEMRRHVLGMYQGVQVSHSYVLDSQTYDCVPVEQQPSIRLLGLKGIAAAPPSAAAPGAPAVQGGAAAQAATALSQLPAYHYDTFGNTLGCEEHTIPMRRITLEEMGRFRNLHEFLKKGPDGAGQAPTSPTPAGKGVVTAPSAASTSIPPSVSAHKYAYTYQWVNNLGGNSALNLWSPYVYTPWSEVFSLSQVWYVGGSPTQTVEGGWQVYPAKYGSTNAALFIYWTADGYQNTGCYNLDCPGFVQVNNNYHFGGGWGTYSTYGGAQYELPLQWYLYAGNWWLSLQGNWVGYYPASIYRGGQLSRYATLAEFGGETVGSTYWPPMGSGQWASSGWTHAAYQRNIYYFDTGAVSHWTSLTDATPSPGCYSDAGAYWGGSSWGVYFYLGGPGGGGC